MMKPIIPANESERQQALNEYNVLDTLAEQEYDDLTKIASFICNTPVSLISLVDDKRQYFKSSHGLNTTETSRDYSFCAHAINMPAEIMIVPDSRLDNRFSDNPLVTDAPHVIFYAGIPLVNPNGFALGTLCVIDDKPGNLSLQQIEILKSLGNQVVKLLELGKTNDLLMSSQGALQEYAEQMKSFAYIASHDLKEPARMVSSFMTLLKNTYANKLDDTAKKYINYAADGAKRMTGLIDELLTYSMADNLNNAKEEINLKEVLKEIIELNEGIIQQTGATITFDDLPLIQGTRASIKIVFQNLIANALKYQPAGVEAKVVVSCRDSETHWEFAVRDNGIGIRKEYHEQIFQMLKRLHSKEEYAGTGIGLATCKKIVESYSGKIWVESEEGEGSTFYFTILKNNEL